MINRPNLENLVKELKELQLDQARIQSRQTEIIDLLTTAYYQGSTEDDRRAQGTQATEQEDTPPQAAASGTQTSF